MTYAISLSALALAALALIYFITPTRVAVEDKIEQAAVTLGLTKPSDDKRGWMDDAPFTPADQARVRELSGQGFDNNLDVIRNIQGRGRSSITRRDFELMRQDVRRALAAYPNLDDDTILFSTWVQADLSARIPNEWGGFNSNGTKVGDKWYLDGGTYQSFVRPEYPNRANAEETRAFFAAKKIAQRNAKRERLEKNGPFASWGGSGGSMTVRLNDKREVVVTRAEEWANKGKRWTMPFVVDEWVDIDAGDLKAIQKLPSFASAIKEVIDVTPSGVSVSVGSFGSTGGVLLPGESMSVGIPVPLQLGNPK